MPSDFPQRRPLLFAGLVLIFMVGELVVAYAAKAVWHQLAFVVTVLGEVLLGLVAVFLLSRLRWWRVAGFRMPRHSPAIFCLLAPCFILFTEANSIFYWWNYLPGSAHALLLAI